mmetsp:Transcript_3923/g.5351  ORF Transcript_3923/g.5351 Transcript_3923/m.5351 type:complete len:121 (+) Transcript_3923:431-793(+)
MLMEDEYTILDHVPFEHCLGYDGASFQEAQDIPQSIRNKWAKTVREIMEDFKTVFNGVPFNTFTSDPLFSTKLERRIKMYFIFLFNQSSSVKIQYKKAMELIQLGKIKKGSSNGFVQRLQ